MINNIKLNTVINRINDISEDLPIKEVNIMEVCGTHTNAIAKFGIKNILSNKINLISGPGCPVCVTNESYIDAAIELSREGIVILTFGDLMRVSGQEGTLLKEKSRGMDIRIIYSVYDVINIAIENKDKTFVFLGVGFETTAPIIAAVIKQAYDLKLHNVCFLSSVKVMPPILKWILSSRERNIHGIICPGNVAVIKGSEGFRFIYDKYKIPSVVCGFDDTDIIASIYFLIKDIREGLMNREQKGFENLYKRCSSDEGNKKARGLIEEVFKEEDALWRGIGLIKASGLGIRGRYHEFDAVNRFKLQKYFSLEMTEWGDKVTKCSCNDILLGNLSPDQCRLFGSICTPVSPCGPCMVSTEGACAAFYRYR
ncbi:hydrogenase formation protein HypD [Clostridium bovifaecis]|uniref:Hydrogenase formation protein HypD n=1 Tax=Clostridium bovifaecis TaxID=2184719 RepID=A0A6I6F5W6_9CLOT|nr:hydrogenase formation protein HypD [Clostridium bovifaecis]